MRGFGISKVWIGLAGALCLAVAAVAEEQEAGTLEDLEKEIGRALGRNDAAAVQAALARAGQLREGADDRQLAGLVKAIGKGVGHKDLAIATASVEALGKLHVRGSSKMLGKLLSPPAKVADDRLPLHLAAFRAAGEIHDAESVKSLEKAWFHARDDVAVAAAESFAGFKALEGKARLDVAGKAVKALAKLEKKVESARKDEEKAAADKVRAALVTSLGSMTGKEGLSKSDDWEAWLREARKS